MFRSSTIIRGLALNLDKVIFMLKHSVKLRRYLLRGCVAACRSAASSVHYTTSCKHSRMLLRMGEIIARNMLS